VAHFLRLLHVVPTYFPAERYGGPIHSVHGLCKALVRRGHQVDVFTTSVDGADRLDVPEGQPVDVDGVSVRYFRSRYDRLYWSPAMSRSLRRNLAHYDVVHLHSVFLWPTASAAFWARRCAKPYVLSPRGMLVPELIAARSGTVKRAWIGMFERRNLAAAARIHVTSAQESDDLSRCDLALAPVLDLPNGVDWVEGVTRSVVSGQILFLGRLSWKKNLEALIDAVAGLPGASLVLAGPDDEQLAVELMRRAEAGGCASRLRILGTVGPEQKRALFASSVCTVLPSLNENFGNVVIEAMAHGCPVVVSPGVGARNIVAESGGGFVATAADAGALRVAIAQLLDDPDSAEQRGAAGAAYVREHLSWDSVAARMADVYREISEK
jgi:glycosyltransferase involved in cell wall biosynthesis